MKSNRDIKKNQFYRKKKRIQRKKNSRIRWIVFGMASIIALSTAGMWTLFDKNANADTAKLMVSTENYEDKEDSKKDVDIKKESKNKYSTIIYGYKKVLSESRAYASVSENSKEALNLKAGEYVKFLGSENGWSKIKHKNIEGYIEDSKLIDTKENELKVIDGVLITTKDYYIPRDFETRFDIETESALMVMLEAMRRDDLDIEVLKKYINSTDELSEDLDSKFEAPDIEHHALRTGSSVILGIQKMVKDIKFNDTAQGMWLSKNAHKYGFILRYPEGKEDITGFVANDRLYSYVGTDKATDIYNNNLTIEEYFR